MTACNSINNESVKSDADSNQSVSIAADTATVKDLRKADENEVLKTRVLVPGKSIGEISLNQKAEEVYKIIRSPDSTDAAMGKAFAFWKSADGKNLTTIYSVSNRSAEEGPKVKQIRITSEYYSTKNGIRTGSSLKEIRRQFPDISKTAVYSNRKGVPVYIYDSVDSGISFDIEDEKAIAITIHEPGVKSTVTYMALHPGIQIL